MCKPVGSGALRRGVEDWKVHLVQMTVLPERFGVRAGTELGRHRVKFAEFGFRFGICEEKLKLG